MGPLGILGGTFDPIHHGHLRLAEEAIEQLGLARVLVVPARPWQRSNEGSDAQRLQMVSLACAGNPRLAPCSLELQRLGPSYSVDTLLALRQHHGAAVPLWLILGADAFLGLPSWHDWELLPTLCSVAVVPRPGIDLETRVPAELAEWWTRRTAPPRDAPAGRLRLLQAPELEISATAIRARIRAGRSPRYLLPDPVLHYIELEGLYRQEGHGA